MPLKKEIWLNDIVEQLFADNSFAARSVDHSEFVNNITVHVPAAGMAPGVTKGRTTFPATVTSRTDADLSYNIGEYSTDPVRIAHADQVELSYNKRQSVLAGVKGALDDAASQDIIYSWLPSSPNRVATTGGNEDAHITGATSTRKAVTKADILAVKKLFDANDIPQIGRYMLLDAVMYNQLLGALSESQANAFMASADAAKGTVGQLYGFDFYIRSRVAKVNSSAAAKAWSAPNAATDSAAGIAWQEGCVSRAQGEHVLFEAEQSPLYYGDVISALVRAGGSYMNAKGVCLLYQAS